MFNRVKEFFQGEATLQVDDEGNATDQDLHVATGVLLLEMAGTDSDYAPEETKAIFAAMESQFGLSKEETLELLKIADSLREQFETRKERVTEFVKAINENFDSRQRQIVLAMIWKVVAADGKLDKFEERFATQMKFRLQLSDEEAEKAKQMALTGEV